MRLQFVRSSELLRSRARTNCELAVDRREVQLGDLVALDEHGARLARVACLQRRELRGLGGHGLLLFGDVDRRPGVLARDRAQVVDPLDQVGKAVGLEDHRRDVRRGRLIGGDHLGDKHLPVAPELDLERGQAGAGGAQLGPAGWPAGCARR